MLFKVLAVAEGYQPRFLDAVDPLRGVVQFQLALRAPVSSEEGRVLYGRVIGPEGRLVVGATVNVEGVRKGRGTTWGRIDYVDPLSVTNEQGLFAIHSNEPIDALDLQVNGRGFARRNFGGLTAGKMIHDLRLSRGASVRGRLLKDGKAVAGVVMGLVQDDRGVGTFLGEYTIGTDDKGRFLFTNVPPKFKYHVYGKMASLKDRGAVPSKLIGVGADGTEVNVGDLEVIRGHRVSGRVLTVGGTGIPSGTRLLLSRDKAWDSQFVELDAEGRFGLTGVPSEIVSLSVRFKGYRLSKKNRSVNLFQTRLEGKVDGDVVDLLVVCEPGEIRFVNPSAGDWARFEDQRRERIRGAPDP